jgi:histidinol-phosphate phosphatase family protein
MRAVIMAGGQGTRLYALTHDSIPKPMVPVCGNPVLQWQIECLRENGITDILIVAGHLGKKIQEFFGDGVNFDISIRYFHEQVPLGTAGSLIQITHFINNDNFLLIFGDTIFDINVQRMINFHRTKGADITLFVHPNSHPYDSDLVIMNKDSRVVSIDSKNNNRTYWYDNKVNAGFYILSAEVINTIPEHKKVDLEKDIVIPNIGRYKVYGYESTEYIKDVGTVDRITQAESDISRGIVSLKNLAKKQKCIFFNRGGMVNTDTRLIDDVCGLLLEDSAAEAIRQVNASPYLAIIIANQPVIVRKLCDSEDLKMSHKKLSTLLGKKGAYLDDILFCFHHPDGGYPGENPAHKIDCRCRKFNIEMILKTTERWNIDVLQSWIVGDTTMDIQIGKNMDMGTVLVKTDTAGQDTISSVNADSVAANIRDAIDLILQNGGKRGAV